ncbi:MULTISPECIES: Tc toxin subunit A-related protein [Niastella]|uniref:PA14 domain-containing protein n=1 Tax=Niastella soli TaxID=2821487 RepID=A0ABS3YXR3_9BACT|nr:neuraminidase-like domain-containing protein [Niastella soli]MBO9202543.1 hypothetical protein [Niastella soli]
MNTHKKRDKRSKLLSDTLAKEKQDVFLDIYAAHENDWAQTRTSLLEKGISDQELKKMELVYQLAEITDDNDKLVTSLQKKLSSIREMALSYDRKKIHSLLQIDTLPEEVPGETQEEKAAWYASHIEKQLYHKEPSAVVARMVKNNELPIKDKAIQQGVLSFFEGHPDFNIRNTSVYAASKENKASLAKVDPMQRTAVMGTLKNIQRISSMSNSPALLPKMMESDLTSAHKVVTQSQEDFIQKYAEQLGGKEEAAQVYEQAANINTRNEFMLAALRDSITGTSVAAIDGKTGREEAIVMVKEMAEQNNLQLNWEALFGNADLCECDECRSVYSASAYLVELLQYLRTAGDGTPLNELLKRRPDIGNLQLTCENANTALPYIDLVNEIMESFIVHLPGYQAEGNVQLDVFDVVDESNEELLAVPQHINYNAYKAVNDAVYPFSLPYNQPLDAIRMLLRKMGTNRYDIMDAFDVPSKPVNEANAMSRAKFAEMLLISKEEHICLTKEDFYKKEYYDAQKGRVLTTDEYQALIGVKPVWKYYGFNTEAEMLSGLKMVKNSFLPRTGISFKDLYAILETKSVNIARPVGASMAMMNRIPYSYRYLLSLAGTATDPAVKYAQVITLLQNAFELPADKTAVRNWVLQDFEKVGKMIVLELGGTTPGNNDDYYYDQGGPGADLYQVAKANDVSKAVLQHLDGTPLTTPEYDTLQRFIRLWRKLNWTIPQTDMAIVGLSPVNSTRYDITANTIQQLSWIRKLSGHTLIPIERLLAFWADISIHGEQSLYKKVFLTPNILAIDPVFAPDVNGNFLAATTTITAHLPGIMAALQMTASEISQIRSYLAMPDVLSLSNISAIFRYGALARYLKLPVNRLLHLSLLFGNPFLNAGATYEFILVCEDIREAGFRPEQLSYMMVHTPEPGIAPSDRTILTIARELHQALRNNESRHLIPQEITADLLKQQLMLVFDEEVSTRIMAFLDGSIVFSQKVNDRLVVIVPEHLTDRFSYNRATGIMATKGILSEEDWSEIGSLSRDKSFQGGVSKLSAQPAMFLNDTLFAMFPVNSAERNLVLGPDGGETSPGYKISLCYNQFIPFLKKQLAQRLIYEKLSKEIQLDAGTTEWLLTMSLTNDDGSQPLVNDFLKIGQQVPPVASWDGYLIPAANDAYTFVIAATQQPALLLNDQPLTVQPVAGATGQYETTPQPLKAGQLYRLKITGLNGDLSKLSWKTATVPRMQVPESCLFPAVVNDTFAATYRKLHKAALFIKGFSFSAEELKLLYISRSGFFNMSLNSLNLTIWRRFREYTVVRNRHKNGSISLAEFLAWMRNPVNATLADKIVALTNWDLARVQALLGSTQFNYYVSNFQNEKPLEKLYQAMSLSMLTGLDTATLVAWAVPLTDFDKCYQQAENIRSCLRARYTEEDWRQTIKPVNDQLRTNQRTALISYLLVQPALQQWAQNRNLALDADTLLEFFLIDLQMESVMETSRIRQAVSSLQLFVQRCFLGLEKAIPATTLDRSKWEWMQQYRTWEASRKVFLYPENWIEPDLRDTKSPFFKELEAELLQQDVTPEVVENAVRNYLGKLNEVGSLDIIAVFQEWPEDKSHIIGRTRSIPYVYYHRTYDFIHVWTPWEKIETDIQLVEEDKPGMQTAPLNGNYLIPVKWKDRLLLFWPVFTKKTVENAIQGTPLSKMSMTQMSTQRSGDLNPLEYREIKLAYSEYRDGKWTAKQTSPCVLNTPAAATAVPISSFIFMQDTLTELLKISVHYEEGNIIKPVGAFTFHDGVGFGTTGADTCTFDMYYPPDTVSKYMHFYPAGPTAPVDITIDIAGVQRGMIFNKPLTNFKLVRTFQKNFTANGPNYASTTMVYQEEGNNGTHRRTMVRYAPYYATENAIENLYHPYVGTFLQQLNQNGLSGLLSTFTQQNRQYATTPQTYNAERVVQWPDGGVDFGKNPDNQFKESYGSYSIYNWELFFHVPLIIADRLSKSRQYEQARNWFHYIFNPLATGPENTVRRYWQFLPFKTSPVDSVRDFLYSLKPWQGYNEIYEWRSDPYNPHLIARSRPAAYMKTVVMKYLDNILAWGDELYRQNTMETINQASILYVIAGHILGPRPQVVPERGTISAQTYNSLKDKWDHFSNAMVEMELAFPYSGQVTYEGGIQNGKPYRGNNIFGFGASLYFNIPNNPQLLQYWDKVADRLFKIRHSMNIDGIVQKLALYEPPIDPALLVQAAANGISLSSVLNDFNVPMPYYRFNHLTAKALEVCADVKVLGSQLLSVIERRDAEALAKLRATQEVVLLNAVQTVKIQQLEEAYGQLDTLYRTRENTGNRLKHFQQLLAITPEVPQEGATYSELDGKYGRMQESGGLQLIDLEREDMKKALQAAQKQTMAGILETAAGVANFFPSTSGHGQPLGVGVTITFGGQHVGAALAAAARGVQTYANKLQFESGAAAKKTGFLRQRQDWILQANTAGNELMQIDKQIITAKIRIAISEKELQHHKMQVEQAREMQDYLAGKYTNQELYQWMEGQVRTTYRQAYQLAYDLARKAEKAYRFERGEANTNFIQLAYWDGSRDGFLAGEQLSLAIRQMERTYMDTHKREYEISKHISLVQWDAFALLNLKETGTCELLLPETMFDLDFPGHYMRRIKSMSVSIPCVAGPYTSISATLTLLNDKTRISNVTGSQYREDTTATDERFVNNYVQLQSIATSHAQQDNGMFELNFRDDRFLPFEGAGAVSRWRLDLPAGFRQFDYDTISDVIFHLQYTAREGGGLLKQFSENNLNSFLENASGEDGMDRLFNLKSEYSNEWYRFQHPGNGNRVLTLTGLKDRLPFFTKSKRVQRVEVTGIELLVEGEVTGLQLNGMALNPAAAIGDLKHFTVAGAFPALSEAWNFTADNAALQDAWLVIRYSIVTN